MSRLGVDDIRGVVAILPTPSLPGADRWDAVDTVDLDETVRMTEAVVAGGMDVIFLNGTFGEAASLTEAELLAFTDAVVRTVAGRVPVFGGATTLNTRDTIARARKLRDLGVDGLFLGRPMWVALDDRQIVDYHAAIAEALPDMPQAAYDNASAFKGKIASGVYARLAEIPQIVAAKHTGSSALGAVYENDLRAVDGRIRLLPLAEDWVPTAAAFPDETVAAWSGDTVCGPAPLAALRDAVLGGDAERAAAVHADITAAMETLFPGGSFAEFSRYNIQIDRAEFEAAGFITPGPARPPYTSAPEEYLEGGREAGRRWAALHRKYLPAVARG